MDRKNSFSYTYSATDHQEVLNIRKKYLPQEETKLEELKRLDRLVQKSGVKKSLLVGICGCLIFGLGMCFGLGALGSDTLPAIPLGLIGTVCMLFAYPVHKRSFNNNKQKYTPRILELSDELSEMILRD